MTEAGGGKGKLRLELFPEPDVGAPRPIASSAGQQLLGVQCLAWPCSQPCREQAARLGGSASLLGRTPVGDMGPDPKETLHVAPRPPSVGYGSFRSAASVST